MRKLRRSFAASDKLQSGPWVLHSATGAPIGSHHNPSDFVEALRAGMSEATDIELLYDLWERNIETLRALHRHTKGEPIIPNLVRHLRACAVALVKAASNRAGLQPLDREPREGKSVRQKIDKSLLTLSEPKRFRSKEHLRFVASQPCLICGRSPSHAHHLRHAQPRGLSLKVSDEFTVPLCAIHHRQIHTTLKEQEWWLERNIDPLKVAGKLWRKSRDDLPDANAAQSDRPKPAPDQNVRSAS